MPALPLLRCLGQFQLELNEQPTPLPTRKTAALLVHLVLHPKPHGREQLATLFWGDSGDEEARRSLRNALTALRKALGETALLADRETVQFNPGYVLKVDAVDFRTQAQRFLAAPTPIPDAVDITLYRGDLLEGFYDDWILREREALRQLYLQVLLRLAQHWRTQGDYLQTSAIAQRILTLDPAEEAAHQHLLFCYTMTGDRQAAQRQYEACVHSLREELDVEPAPETVALYRRSQQTRSRKPSVTAAHTNLPLPVSSFIGRGPEIAKLKGLLRGDQETTQRPPVRLVTITGPGGCGKTRLAIQVARDLLDGYADGIWWVELAALSEDSQVPQAVAKVLDVQQGIQPSLTDVLITNLRTKQMLLVLDNCEHLVAACAELAERLLSQCPDLQILTTSREAFGIFGEVNWLVPSLTLPGVERTDYTKPEQLAELLQFEGIQLFVERASAAQRTFSLMPANTPALLQICQQLDGIPLAIELAAARVKLMTVEQLATRLMGALGARFNLLTDGSRTILPRQQTLRATMAWSYALLNDQEQKLLQQLAIFAGGWTLEAAEATGALLTAPQSVAGVLARLVDKSLVLVEPQGEAVRYQMLETVRQYAYEQLEKMKDAPAARDRHLAYFRQLVEHGEPELRAGGQLIWLRRLVTESDNLRVALSWGLQHEPVAADRLLSGAGLATELIFHWKLHSDWLEGRSWLEETAHLLEIHQKIIDARQVRQITALRAKALYGAGVLVWHQGKWDESWQLLLTSTHLARSVGDFSCLFRAQAFQADLYLLRGDWSTACALWQECRGYFNQVQEPWLLAEATFFLGYAERRAGNFAAAIPYYEEAIALLRSLGERWLLSLTLSHLGLIAFAQGDYGTAYRQIEQRLLMGREFGLKQHIYTALDFLADIAYQQGHIRQAAMLLREALALQQKSGVDLLFANLIVNLGIMAQACIMDGHYPRAVRLLAAQHALALLAGDKDIEEPSPLITQLLQELHTRLDDDGFSTAWATGAAMTLEQALAELLAED